MHFYQELKEGKELLMPLQVHIALDPMDKVIYEIHCLLIGQKIQYFYILFRLNCKDFLFIELMVRFQLILNLFLKLGMA